MTVIDVLQAGIMGIYIAMEAGQLPDAIPILKLSIEASLIHAPKWQFQRMEREKESDQGQLKEYGFN